MLRCRPTRITLKQEDMQEYEVKRIEWCAEAAAAETQQFVDDSFKKHNSQEDIAKFLRRKETHDRLGVTGKI